MGFIFINLLFKTLVLSQSVISKFDLFNGKNVTHTDSASQISWAETS